MKVLFLCTGNSVRGQPMRLAWSLEDPAAFEGDAAAKLAQFREMRDQIRGQPTRLAANAARGLSCPYGQVAVSSSRNGLCRRRKPCADESGRQRGGDADVVVFGW